MNFVHLLSFNNFSISSINASSCNILKRDAFMMSSIFGAWFEGALL